jgi:acetylornithine deacetylase/succinyl-diaminopimelate desuccinylase-like protein
MAATVPERNEWVQLAARALKAEWGKSPVYMADGGSIPVVGTFRRVLGLPCLLTGWSQGDDGAHSPNEKYDVESFHRGMRSWARIIGEIARGMK